MNNTEKTVAILQDMQGLLTEIQPLLTDCKVADLRVVAAVRLIRKETGQLLEDLTNEQRIVDGYREDAIDAVCGLHNMLSYSAHLKDAELQQAMIGMTLAVARIRKYFRCKQAAQEAPTCEAG